MFDKPIPVILELFGHQTLAGYASTFVLGDTTFLRLDTPACDPIAAYTRFYGPKAIYSITPTDEESMLHAVQALKIQPIETWKIPFRQLPAETDDTEDW